jgi:hypothetical protein
MAGDIFTYKITNLNHTDRKDSSTGAATVWYVEPIEARGVFGATSCAGHCGRLFNRMLHYYILRMRGNYETRTHLSGRKPHTHSTAEP